MTHISLTSIDMYKKLNAKRLLTFGIIVMLTSVAVMCVRPVSAEPWWFLPAKWHYETGTGSNRTMIICTEVVDTSIPPPSVIDTTGKVSFDLDISAPNSSGLATITVPEASVSIEQFYIKDIFGLVDLWGELYATGDGNGTLATVDDVLDVDIYSEVIGYGNGTYAGTTIKQIGDGTPDPAGSSLVYLPLELHIWSGQSDTDPTPTTPTINLTTPFPIYVTTGFTKTTIVDPTPYPSGSVSMNGKQINGTGVPADSDTGVLTCVATGGGLDLYESLLGLYSDYLFKEVMVATPSPPIPSEPITSVTVSPTTVLQGDSVDINVTVYNGLASSATFNITVYANDTVIETRTDVTVAAGDTTTLEFTWDTTGVPPGNYTIKAELDGEVDGTTYTFSDSYIDGTVLVTIPIDVTIEAYCYTEGTPVSVSITMDGSPTGFTTSHTFTGLTGTHTFTVPSNDLSGHPFKNWSTSETSTTITVTSNGTYTAYYQTKYTLNITTTTGGTTNPSPGTYPYWDGTSASVTAIPSIGYLLDYWELDGNNVGASNPISVTMNTNHTLQAVFSQAGTYNLTINTTAGGTTSPAPETYTYTNGTAVSVTAIPDTNYVFDHWELDGSLNYSNPISVTMDSDHTLQAVFTYSPPTYDVTIKAHCYSEGVDVSVNITMDGSPTEFTTPHTFTGLTGTHNFTVPNTDPNGHPFKQWNTGENSTTITVTSNGTCTAYYENPQDDGTSVPDDEFGSLIPYIGLASIILVAIAVTAIYIMRRKKKQ